MNKVLLLLTMSVTPIGLLTAQNFCVVQENVKIVHERVQRQNEILTISNANNFNEGVAGDKEKKMETQFLNKTKKMVNSDIKQYKPDYENQEGKLFRWTESKQQQSEIKRERDQFNNLQSLSLKSGNNQKNVPHELPFIENFDTEESFIANWDVIDANDDGYSYQYCDWNYDADGGFGCVQVSGQPIGANEYLISVPLIIHESGTYNISFWAYIYGYGGKLRILYSTSSNYEEMNVLEEYDLNTYNFGLDWGTIFKNFEIETPGNYYFAFHYFNTPENWWNGIDIDKIKITIGEFVGIPDIKFINGLAPRSSCDMDCEIIGAEVFNRGSASISVFTLTYQINEETQVIQTFTETIGERESINVYFDQQAYFSEVGDYYITFTASTPDEENINNNEIEIVVKHFETVTELPFISDFINEESLLDWIPEMADTWRIDTWTGSYYAYEGMPNVPLISRCITLEPDTYRFSFNVFAGYGGKVNFYVTCGKSGTNPYEWEPVKEFFNYSTSSQRAEEEFFIIEITDTGEYEFAFFPVQVVNLIHILGTVVEVAPEHDFSIKKIESSDFFRITPVFQFESEKTFTAILQNKGKTANESGNIKLLLNDNEIISQNFDFKELGETLNVILSHVYELLPVGRLSLKFEASIPSGLSNEFEIFKEVSDSTYAYDSIDEYFFDALGFDGIGGLGLIYELQKADILTTINIGFVEWEWLAEKDIIIAVYEVNDNYKLGEIIFEVEHKRTIGNDMSGITFDVPDIQLQPGKYFFEVRQLDNESIGIACDLDPMGHTWIYAEDNFYSETSYGYVHIRPNFGNPPVVIAPNKLNEPQLTLFPNPSRGKLTINNKQSSMERIVVYNAAGQVVLSVSNVNDTSYSINTEKFSTGLYFISIQTKNGILNSKFVVK